VEGLSSEDIKRFESDALERNQLLGKAIGIHSYSPCSHCRYVPLDEEVWAAWARTPAHSGPFLRRPQSKPHDEDLGTSHILICGKCSQPYDPVLHVRSYETVNPMSRSPNNTSPNGASEIQKNNLKEGWTIDVPYLSASDVRGNLEDAVRAHGASVLRVSFMFRQYPTLLWNILWYSCRFNLPPGLITAVHDESDCDHISGKILNEIGLGGESCPIIVGWNERVVLSRVDSILSGLHSPALGIRELFHNTWISAPDTSSIASHLDGTLAGMTRAIKAMFEVARKEDDDIRLGNCVDALHWTAPRKTYHYLFAIYCSSVQNKEPNTEAKGAWISEFTKVRKPLLIWVICMLTPCLLFERCPDDSFRPTLPRCRASPNLSD